ncbi:hypothetical protein HMPREF9104_02659 [Lentilactobacillus kisonensis F0435]|uniref:Uncharacterized protein n=1 Tax=Lentilactobacillus kisonensis F0435 TaxID=797516 RepID=H1LJ67_9LACO|nr:hypothetical protein HMPREF9104_02659 [Lentilactobacillus kisonensis F0435]
MSGRNLTPLTYFRKVAQSRSLHLSLLARKLGLRLLTALLRSLLCKEGKIHESK